MRRTLFAALLGVATIGSVAVQAESWAERQAKQDEARATERCLAGGGKQGTPEFQACVRDTMAWMESNRRLQQRVFTQ